MIAEVIINRTAKKLNRTFDYHVPNELEGLILVGSKVLVPFRERGKIRRSLCCKTKRKNKLSKSNQKNSKIRRTVKG